MTSPKRYLRLVPFQPDDYSVGMVLGRENREEIADPPLIDAALSLYFQWPGYRSAILIQQRAEHDRYVSCSMFYDTEERRPTQIFVKMESGSDCDWLQEGVEVAVRFEVFRTCYEITCLCLARSTQVGDDWHAILSVPSKMYVFKHRRLPRVAVDPALASSVDLQCTWAAADGAMAVTADIAEMSMLSIKITTKQPIAEGHGILSLNHSAFSGECLRASGGVAIIRLVFETGLDAGRYFDHYRLFAFPHLRSKWEFDTEQLLALYRETNYFGKFPTNDQQRVREQEIAQTWEAISSDKNASTADYVVVDEQGTLCGASSIALAFQATEDTEDIWALHQLCARTNPELLQNSGELYTWRAEYLAAKPGTSRSVVWFDGRSRWLERIYVKFSRLKAGSDPLRAVDVVRGSIKGMHHADISTEQRHLGNSTRFYAKTPGIFAALSPRFLNASGILDAVVAVDKDSPFDEAIRLAEELVYQSSQTESAIEITVDHGKRHQRPEFQYVDDATRFLDFSNAHQADFLASVEHSLAVTNKKLEERRAQ